MWSAISCGYFNYINDGLFLLEKDKGLEILKSKLLEISDTGG
jgi:hypothetical protein